MTIAEYNNCVTLYSDNVFRFILKNIRHTENAQDIVQSSFEKMWLNKDKVEFAKSKSYLFTIAYNQMIDFIRKNKRIDYTDNVPLYNVTLQNSQKDLKRVLMKALDTLNEVQKSLVMLKDYEGYSYQEIGEIMNLSESKVKVYLHRARMQLREFIVNPENVI
jgi:RNA polymerase sigma factor (sigma-70 family)